jgi:hypothetical protein
MCGRSKLKSRAEIIVERFRVIVPPKLPKRCNIAPSQLEHSTVVGHRLGARQKSPRSGRGGLELRQAFAAPPLRRTSQAPRATLHVH